MTKGHEDLCSKQCGARCCREVSRLPFLGEPLGPLYNRLFIGALPDIEDPTPTRRPFVVEWQVPQELPQCPALTLEGLCEIYDQRPISCRRFPLIEGGGIHPFCELGVAAMGVDIEGDMDFLQKKEAVDRAIGEAIGGGDLQAISLLLQEERPFNAPFLYNGYLVAVLLAAGVDPVRAMYGQKGLIDRYRAEGFDAFTFILPDTDYVVTAGLEELAANLEWLLYRLEEGEMVGSMTLTLESLFEKG